MGWVCTTAGTPGTWKPFGEIVGIVALADQATPSVVGGSICTTGGPTTITDFDDGTVGQTITVLSEHAIRITDGTHIILDGSADFVMAASDSLTLVLKADNKWYETGRTVSAQTVFTGSATWNPVNVPGFMVRSVSVSCPGATVGMFVKCSLSSLDDGANQFTVHISGFVESGGGPVRVSLTNMKSAAVTVPSGTVQVSASAT